MSYLNIARSAVTGYERNEINERTPRGGALGNAPDERNERNEKTPEVEAAAMAPQLEVGWTWLASHPNHPEHEPFLARWLARLHEYERTYAGQDGGTI